jgi:hypothetical protein
MIHESFEEFAAFSYHEVLRATLPCGAEYAIDTAGLQMGWKHSIVPWDVYEQIRLRWIKSQDLVPPQPLGSIVLGLDQVACFPSQRRLMAETVAHGVMKVLEKKVGGFPVEQLLRLKQTDFTTCRGEIVAAMKRGLSTLAWDIAHGAQPTLVKPSLVEIALASSETDLACSLIDMLYLTPRGRAGVEDGSRTLAEIKHCWHALLRLGELPGLDRSG